MRGVRVGEASNPGPVQTRQARRAEHDRVIADGRVHREDDEPLHTAPDSLSTSIGSRRRRRRLRPLPWSWDSDSELDEPVSASRGRGEVEDPDDEVQATEPAVSIPTWVDQSQGLPQETDPPPSLLPTWVDMSRGDEVEAREPHRRRIMPGQGRVDPMRMEDEADDVVRALERDLPLSHTPTTMLTGRRLVLFPQIPGGTPRSVQDCGVESSDTEVHEAPGDMPLGVATAVQAQPRGLHCGRFAVLAEDTDNGAAPTMSQEPRPARRLVLVGGRSGREGVEFRRDPSVHADADTERWPQQDAEGSEGEVEDSVAGDEEVHIEDEEEEREVVGGLPRGVSLRMALASLDEVDPRIVFRQRASVMRSVPKFLEGPFRNALKLALEEATWGNSVQDEVRQERGWKLLELLPRMLLHRAPGGGLIAKKTLEARFQAFARGEWVQLLRVSSQCDEKAAVSRRRQGRRRGHEVERRVARAETLIHLGELSSARQALEGSELAPGTMETLDILRDPRRRPPVPRAPLPAQMMDFQPEVPFQLDQQMFGRNLRSSKRGAAGGPSGMTTEHLRPLLSDGRGMRMLFHLGENLARGHVPEMAVSMVRAGRMTALRKPDGGVRGIVAGDVVRRLVARTMAQQLGPATKAATAPHQYALLTRSGCECVAHVLQGLTELNPRTTVTSIDGVSAYDMISRRSMLDGLCRVEGGHATLPFVRMFYGRPSEYLWEDAEGEVHSIAQGEGGEQGDPMMPLLFAMGQHHALDTVSRSLREDEKLLAYLDDIYFCCEPDRVGEVYTVVQEALQTHAGISIHGGKTKVWNMAGERPPVCDVLEQIARVSDPTARVSGFRGGDRTSGDQDSGHPSRTSRFRAVIWWTWSKNNMFCWRGSRCCRTSKERGSSWCIALQPSKLCCEVRQARSSGAVCSSARRQPLGVSQSHPPV